MNSINVQSAKFSVVFRAGELPRIDPAAPEFVLDLGGVQIAGKVNSKAARKLAEHQGGAILQGRLIVEGGRFVLADAGFQFLEPKPVGVT